MDAKKHIDRNKARGFARGISTVMLTLLLFIGVMYAIAMILKALLG